MKFKKEPIKEPIEEKPRFYKGYDVRWLKFEASEMHPDKKIIKEYEEIYGEVK